MNAVQDKIMAYFDRNPELRVLFIFNDEWLTADLAEMEWPEGYRYVDFKGDWFTTKYHLDNEWKQERVILLFHQESPLQRKSLQETFPLMDVLAANMEYHSQDYAAFMQQYNLPANMTRCVEKNIQLLQSEKMLKLLIPYYADGSITEDIVVQGVVSHFMGLQRVLDWDNLLLRILFLGRESEDRKRTDFYVKLRKSLYIQEYLQNKLSKIFGVGYNDNTPEKVSQLINTLKYNAITQNLTPVEADNYQMYRINDGYALQHINRILELAQSQEQSSKALIELFEELGRDIREEEIIRWYGIDANYHWMPDALCIPIIRTLLEQKMETEPNEVVDRIEGLILKHQADGEMVQAMEYALLVARFYDKALSLGTLTLDSPNMYVENYRQDYFLLDQLYRQALENYLKIKSTAKLFETIQCTKKKLDVNYSKLANRINLEWMRCVKEAGGMMSLSMLRQQDFYESYVKPAKKKQVVIVSDALRYEVAQELIQVLARRKHLAQMDVALSMLPTETKYCKLALFPHRSLKLYGDDKEQNMSVDDKILHTTFKRSEHLGLYKADAICVDFQEVASYEQEKNREIFKHPLVYIMHNTIDEESHNAPASKVVAACRRAIDELDELVHKIHESYSVSEVYIISDHGFLFNDMVFADKDKHKVEEEYMERKSRYYLTHSSLENQDVVKFPLNDVSDIENGSSVFVAVPTGTNRLAAPAGDYIFAHGGASLQEMIIPVIVSHHQRTNKKQPVDVMLLDRKLSMQSSRLRFKLLQTDAVAMDTRERVVTCALYFNDSPVTQMKTISLDKTDLSLDNRKIQVDLVLNCNVNAKVLQLKIYDVEDPLNPLIKENVTNNTLIENDFDF